MIDDVKEQVRDRQAPDIILGAKNNDLQEVERAVKYHPENLNAVEQSSGFTALQYAVARGNLEIVSYLLKQNGIEITLADKLGRTPLELAVEVGHQGVVAELLRARAERS